jgi:hypothetical protein
VIEQNSWQAQAIFGPIGHWPDRARDHCLAELTFGFQRHLAPEELVRTAANGLFASRPLQEQHFPTVEPFVNQDLNTTGLSKSPCKQPQKDRRKINNKPT